MIERQQQVLREFVVDALAALDSMYETPEIDPDDDYDTWSRSPEDPELLKRVKKRGAWHSEYGSAWPEWVDLRNLKSYAAVLEIFLTDESVLQRALVAYGLPYEMIRIGLDDLSNIERLLQQGLLAPQINKGDFVFDDQVFSSSLDRVIKSLRDTNVVIRTYTPLRYVYAASEVRVSPNCSIRPLTDEELDTAVGFGILPFKRIGADTAYLPDRFQTVVAREYRFDLAPSFPCADKLVDALVKRDWFEETEQSDADIVAAVGLMDKIDAIDRGERWMELRTSAQNLCLREGSVYAPEYFHRGPRTIEISADDGPRIGMVVAALANESVRDRLSVAVDRLLVASTRHRPSDSIVDLAIAAESLFCNDSRGEATQKISVHAALFLADEGYGASDVRTFFKKVYDYRSSIVHGSRRRTTRQRDELIELRDQLAIYMKRALRKAIAELAENSAALDWALRLDRCIDGPNNVARVAGAP